MLYNLAKTILGKTAEIENQMKMTDLTPEEVEQYHKNIENHSRIIPGYNLFDEIEKLKNYYFVVNDNGRIYTVYLPKNCNDYWEALREAQYWCVERPNCTLKKVGFE